MNVQPRKHLKAEAVRADIREGCQIKSYTLGYRKLKLVRSSVPRV